MTFDKVEAGDIFFTCDDSWISKIIRFVTTGGKINKLVPSHCGVVLLTYINNDTIIVHTIEALFHGVRHHILNNYCKCGTNVWLARMRGERDYQKGLKWLEKQVFVNYDIFQLLGIFIRAILQFLVTKAGLKSPKIKNFLASKQKFICSELVENFAIQSGERLWKGDVQQVTPYDLYRSDKIDIYEELFYYKKRMSQSLLPT